MSYLILFLVSVGPGLAWLWYFYRQDKYAPEPRSLITLTFVAGMVAVFPAAMVEFPFRSFITNSGSLLGLAFSSVVFIGIPEEIAKYLAVRWSIYGHPEFDEPVDGIIYSVSVGLGFAALENLFYAISFGIAIAPLRALVACLAHVSFSGILGYYLGLAKFNPLREQFLIRQGLIIAILLHAAYDFFILAPNLPAYLSLLVLGLAYRFLRQKIEETRLIRS